MPKEPQLTPLEKEVRILQAQKAELLRVIADLKAQLEAERNRHE